MIEKMLGAHRKTILENSKLFKENGGIPKQVGRPPILNNDQKNHLVEFITKEYNEASPVTPKNIQLYIFNKFGIGCAERTYHKDFEQLFLCSYTHKHCNPFSKCGNNFVSTWP
jgi:transposase